MLFGFGEAEGSPNTDLFFSVCLFVTSNVVLLFALFACGGGKEKPVKSPAEQQTKSPAEPPSPAVRKLSKAKTTTTTTATASTANTKSPSSTAASEVFKWDEESKIEPGCETTLTKKAWETESAYIASTADPTIASALETATVTATALSTLGSTYKSTAKTQRKPSIPQISVKAKK
ncbi:hypothetical protein TTRE_0000538401 [Trichuris trichiura]|uniref:Uncharacterized protein n=1 Tax=Trichuris trichiura TaxID=36087 RepID=A0A077ZB78_TRITR|nr:hypothetical protein TTRE_0000538401 [Trichuris trichiura]